MNEIPEVCCVQRAGEPPCHKPATCGYPAMGGGYAYLCEEHCYKCLHYTQPLADIKAGIPHRWHLKKESQR